MPPSLSPLPPSLPPSLSPLPPSLQETSLKKQVEGSEGIDSQLAELRQQLGEVVREREELQKLLEQQSASHEEKQR